MEKWPLTGNRPGFKESLMGAPEALEFIEVRRAASVLGEGLEMNTQRKGEAPRPSARVRVICRKLGG